MLPNSSGIIMLSARKIKW